MLKKAMITVTALGLFGLIGFAFAQPVQQSFQNNLQTPNSNFAPRAFATPQSSRPASRQQPASGWILRMNDGEVVSADLAENFEITLKTAYGDVTLPSDEIISLRIIQEKQSLKKPDNAEENNASGDDTPEVKARRIVVATVSGDIISGKSDFESVALTLSWGVATATADSIDFICNRKFGVMTIVNHQSSPAFILSSVRLETTATRIVEQSRATHVITPGRLSQPTPSRIPTIQSAPTFGSTPNSQFLPGRTIVPQSSPPTTFRKASKSSK